jgi:tripartite-type tricarboxylate transporter receptor subunit TctC
VAQAIWPDFLLFLLLTRVRQPVTTEASMFAYRVRSALIALSALTFGIWSVAAHADDPFYKGKRLTFLVNYAAGGPSDIEGRLLVRHIGKYLAGNPTIIVQNMDGAGGMIGNNYLGEIAPKDGTMVGYFTGSAWNAAFNPENFHTDFKTFEFVAYQPGTSIYFMRTDTKPGLKTATDIVKAEGVVAGGLGVTNAKDLLIRLSLDILGVQHKYVTSYQGNTAARLAIERGEINYYSESPPGYLSVVAPGMVKEGVVIPIFYDPGWNGETFNVPKQVQGLDILPFQELYRKINGKLPSGQLFDAYLSILTVNSGMQRLVAMPPKTPQAAIDALRAALMRLNDDQAYQDEAQKLVGFKPDYVAGPNTNKEVRQALNTTPEARAFIADYIKKGGH